MSHQDEVAAKAIRKSTLTSLKVKKQARLKQLKEDYEEAVRKVNIEYAKEPERLKAKYAADEYAKNERSKRRAAKKVQREEKAIDLVNSLRPFSLAEEIASSIVQGLGAAMAIVVLVIFEALVVNAITDYKNLSIVLYTLLGSTTITMYTCSVLSHALRNITAKEVFKRLSHCFSFVMISIAYTAYSLTKIQGLFGWILFGIVVGVALVGCVLYGVFGTRFEKGIIPFYVVSGWAGLVAAKVLLSVLSSGSFNSLVLAGALYVIALVFYSLRKIKWMHFVGNCLMLAGSVCMFLSIIFSVINQ